MKSTACLIADFLSGAGDKCWITRQLEVVADDEVVSLFVNAVTDWNELETVRIEILKALPLRSDTAPNRERLGTAALTVLLKDPESLVRSYAAMALRHYIDLDGVLASLVVVVRDECDDIDVRYNALDAIESNTDSAACVQALRKLVDVPKLGESAQRVLNQLGR